MMYVPLSFWCAYDDIHTGDRALFNKFFLQKKIETHLPVLCEQTLKAIKEVSD